MQFHLLSKSTSAWLLKVPLQVQEGNPARALCQASKHCCLLLGALWTRHVSVSSSHTQDKMWAQNWPGKIASFRNIFFFFSTCFVGRKFGAQKFTTIARSDYAKTQYLLPTRLYCQGPGSESVLNHQDLTL